MFGERGFRPQRERLYRSRHGFLFGVCRGLADYLGVPVFWVRTAVLVLLVFSGLWPVAGIYLAAAALLKPEPVLPTGTDDEREFYNSYSASPDMALSRLKRQYEATDRRIRRIEDLVTSREYDWDKRLRS
jgi:phage shock protein C